MAYIGFTASSGFLTQYGCLRRPCLRYRYSLWSTAASSAYPPRLSILAPRQVNTDQGIPPCWGKLGRHFCHREGLFSMVGPHRCRPEETSRCHIFSTMVSFSPSMHCLLYPSYLLDVKPRDRFYAHEVPRYGTNTAVSFLSTRQTLREHLLQTRTLLSHSRLMLQRSHERLLYRDRASCKTRVQ